MKEFRQYDKKYCDRETSHCCLSLDIYCEHCEELRKQGWRAALEMVLNHRKPYYTIEDKKVVATDSDIIYEELEK